MSSQLQNLQNLQNLHSVRNLQNNQNNEMQSIGVTEQFETRLTVMEKQLREAIVGLKKKESYVDAMAIDLEHIIMQLIKKLGNKQLVLS